jgi:acyl-CoA reductase-like NAD-dependent aldehyde dehydrogenase
MKTTTKVEQVRSRIAGGWADVGGGFDVTSPASGALLATASRATHGDLHTAVGAARECFEQVRMSGVADRVAWCDRVSAAVTKSVGRLAHELAEEQGKPLAEAVGEVTFAARGFAAAGEWVRGLEGHVLPVEDAAKFVVSFRQPRGVWAAVTPWNFPLNIPVEYLGAALATASPVVWKPAPTTTRIAYRLMEIIAECDVPPSLVQMLVSDDVALAEALTTHPGIDAVGLTGSSATGRRVSQAAWDKHLLLELGGNGPVIVLDDADPDVAATVVSQSAFWNAGQVCSAAGRVLAAEQVADDLAERVARRALSLNVGDNLEPGCEMGPVHLAQVADQVERHVQDAQANGARVLAGGGRLKGQATTLFVAPTVLDHVPLSAAINREETFGPIAPITRLQDDEAVLAAANSSPHGLVSAVVTTSLKRAFWFGERLQTGLVVVNDQSNYWELSLPFGGWAGKTSGRGRLGGRAVIEEFTQTKVVALNVR